MSANRADSEWRAYKQGGSAYGHGFWTVHEKIAGQQPQNWYTRCWLMGWRDAALIASTKEKSNA